MKLSAENGYNELIINENCDFNEFYKIADIIDEKLKPKFLKLINDYDTLYLPFIYYNTEITLYYNSFLGISLYPSKGVEASELDNNTIELLKKELEQIL